MPATPKRRANKVAVGTNVNLPTVADSGVSFGDEFAETSTGAVYKATPDGAGGKRWLGIAGVLGVDTQVTRLFGGLTFQVRASGVDFVADSAGVFDYIILITNTAVPRTVTLPAAASVPDGRVFVVGDASGGAGANNITVTTAGGNINGGASVPIATNYGSVTVVRYAGAYYTI